MLLMSLCLLSHRWRLLFFFYFFKRKFTLWLYETRLNLAGQVTQVCFYFLFGYPIISVIQLSNFHNLCFYRFKLRMHGIQVDNQLPLSPMPVLFRPQRVGEGTEYILKFSLTMQSNGSLDLCVYPYIGVQVSCQFSKYLAEI